MIVVLSNVALRTKLAGTISSVSGAWRHHMNCPAGAGFDTYISVNKYAHFYFENGQKQPGIWSYDFGRLDFQVVFDFFRNRTRQTCSLWIQATSGWRFKPD